MAIPWEVSKQLKVFNMTNCYFASLLLVSDAAGNSLAIADNVSIDVISNMKEAHCACSEVALQSMLLRTRMSNSFYVVGHIKSTFIPSGPDQ